MIEELKKLNAGLEFYDVNEKEFSSFGRVITALIESGAAAGITGENFEIKY